MPLEPEEFKWFWMRPAICECGTKMRFVEIQDKYRCFQCGMSCNRLGANADLRTLNNWEKNRIDFSRE